MTGNAVPAPIPPEPQTDKVGISRLSVFNGGVILMTRQLLGYGLKLIGLFLITRVLGPERYAAYVAAGSLIQYPVNMFLDGLNAYLVLGGQERTEDAERNVQSILAILATVIVLTILTFAGPLGDLTHIPDAGAVMVVLVFFVPFQLLMLPAYTRLERALEYRKIAGIELAGQVTYYAVAAPLVLNGGGAVSLAYGFVAQWVVSFFCTFFFTRMVPRLGFSWPVAVKIVRFALSYSLVSWTWQLKTLINPLLVGPLLGANALGIVGMANTVVDLSAFVKTIIYRICLAILGRCRDDMEKLRNAITYGLQFQTLTVGIVLLGFSWFSGWIVPIAFGERWMPILQIYPFIAFGFLTNALFNIHSAVLIAINRPFDVILFHLTYVSLFALVVALAVPHFGLVGYGFGEIAAIPAYLLLHVYATRRVGSPDYQVGLIWLCGAGIGLFWRNLHLGKSEWHGGLQ